MWRQSPASVTDFALGDLSVLPRLGATERCLMDAEGPVDRVRVRIAAKVPCRRREFESGAPERTRTLNALLRRSQIGVGTKSGRAVFGYEAATSSG